MRHVVTALLVFIAAEVRGEPPHGRHGPHVHWRHDGPTRPWPGPACGWWAPAPDPWFPLSSGPIVLPPYIPIEPLYGPEATLRFFGWDRLAVPAPDPGVRNAPDAPADEKPAAARGSNAEAVALGRRFLAFGDAQFGKQKYADAADRYRKAAQAAPALADAWFRQGYAAVAQGKYDRAAKAFRQGLTLDPGWPRCGFTSAALYGENRGAQAAHLESLALAAEKDRDNPDLLFLVGVLLHTAGQADRAAPFFRRAQALAGGNAEHLQAFLP